MECRSDGFAFDAGPETLALTNLGGLQPGDTVNLEPSLRVGDRLGGHFVSGHIEGTGELVGRRDDREWSTLWFSYPRPLGRYLVPKGSIAVDGVSLTLVEVLPERFSVALIPHTLEATTLGRLNVGDRINSGNRSVGQIRPEATRRNPLNRVGGFRNHQLAEAS